MTLPFLVWIASARKDSLNRRLGERVQFLLEGEGHQAVIRTMAQAPLPLYDADLEQSQGIPQAADELAQAITAARGVIVVTPEYNGGIPGTLKNAVDWLSRRDEVPLDGKPVLLMSASPGAFGGIRGLWHTRVPFEAIGALVYPSMVAVPKADQAVLSPESLDKRLKPALEEFVSFTERLASS